ncbi:hypothetical protein H4R20_002868, partial [Coemansia guatemalensis]
GKGKGKESGDDHEKSSNGSNDRELTEEEFNDSFAKDDIYYDARANPKRHLKAFYMLCQILEENNAKMIQCFPLRKNWVHAHMHLDTIILCQQLLNVPGSSSVDKWSEVLNLESRPFKERSGRKFHGAIDTDGVAITVVSGLPIHYSTRSY